jgi:hypothetical protein
MIIPLFPDTLTNPSGHKAKGEGWPAGHERALVNNSS